MSPWESSGTEENAWSGGGGGGGFHLQDGAHSLFNVPDRGHHRLLCLEVAGKFKPPGDQFNSGQNVLPISGKWSRGRLPPENNARIEGGSKILQDVQSLARDSIRSNLQRKNGRKEGKTNLPNPGQHDAPPPYPQRCRSSPPPLSRATKPPAEEASRPDSPGHACPPSRHHPSLGYPRRHPGRDTRSCGGGVTRGKSAKKAEEEHLILWGGRWGA